MHSIVLLGAQLVFVASSGAEGAPTDVPEQPSARAARPTGAGNLLPPYIQPGAPTGPVVVVNPRSLPRKLNATRTVLLSRANPGGMFKSWSAVLPSGELLVMGFCGMGWSVAEGVVECRP